MVSRVAPPDRLAEAFAEEERQGLALGMRVRLPAIAAIAVWITIENGFPEVLFFLPPILVFLALSCAPTWLVGRGAYRPWHRYLFPFLEFALLTAAILAPNPLADTNFPPTLDLRMGNQMYFFAFLTTALFSYSPRIVLWSGFAAALAWAGATFWVSTLPGVFTTIDPEVWKGLGYDERIHAIVDPNRLDLGGPIRAIVVILVSSAGMAASVWRSRRLVRRYADAERARTNLSRYFSDNVVEELANSDDPIGRTSRQEVAVLFADIVGFTALSETREPEAVIALLREFHARIETDVFEFGGTLDKYIGDGVMITFGTPVAGPNDAASAVRCALAIRESIRRWNVELADAGEVEIRVGVGVHFGPVIVGDVGSDRHLEFTVIGDTVNVASRLEALTRELGRDVVISRALYDRARHDGMSDAELANFEMLEAREVRGRTSRIEILGLRNAGG